MSILLNEKTLPSFLTSIVFCIHLTSDWHVYTLLNSWISNRSNLSILVEIVFSVQRKNTVLLGKELRIKQVLLLKKNSTFFSFFFSNNTLFWMSRKLTHGPNPALSLILNIWHLANFIEFLVCPNFLSKYFIYFSGNYVLVTSFAT